MPTPIKPREWRMSQAEPTEADQTLQMFVGPIDDVKGMLENFESLCQMGKWHEALVGLQMANKWILDVERNMLEFLGVEQEETISGSDPSNPRFAQAGYDQFGEPTPSGRIISIIHQAQERLSNALREMSNDQLGFASNSVAEAREGLEIADRLIIQMRDSDPRYASIHGDNLRFAQTEEPHLILQTTGILEKASSEVATAIRALAAGDLNTCLNAIKVAHGALGASARFLESHGASTGGVLTDPTQFDRQASNFRESDITLQERKDQEGDISYETLRRFAKW